MTDVSRAVEYLKSKNIEAFDGSGILVVPCQGPSEVVERVSTVKRYLKEIEYDKSWQINPYYYDEFKRMKGDFDL